MAKNISSIALILALAFLCLPACAQEIAIVRGTTSTPDEAERNYADSASRLLDRLLTEIGIPHQVITDDTLASGKLNNTKVLILGYNPNPPQKEMTALKAFINKGGKLIVFYSSDPELAKLMKMRLGSYLSEQKKGRWSRIVFTKDAPPHAPLSIGQESRNIMPAYPLPDKSRIAASWENSSGKTAPEPALVQSDSGFWMSHVLMDDGDTEDKKQLLLSMIALYVPSAWISAASNSLKLNTLPGHQNFKPLTGKSKTIINEMKLLFDTGKFPDVVRKGRELSSCLTEAYAGIQQPAPDKFRGLWEQTGLGLFPGDWERTCRIVATNGFTDILPNMLSTGVANYDSKVVPLSETFNLYGDQLAQSIEAAHRNGLRVHAWKMCWRVDSTGKRHIRNLKMSNRLQVTDGGTTINWLCPSNPENIEEEKNAVREILQKYAVDGIHLDFIRYRDSHTCFCNHCKISFEKDTGQKIAKWPFDKNDAELKKEFNRWRCAQITRLVREISVLIRSLKPGVKLSAAVYGYYPGCTETIAQDWGTWLKEGLVDFVCPMNYLQSIDHFKKITEHQLSLPGSNGKIYPGIGVTALESRLNTVQIIDQIVALRQLGAAGFTLFDLDGTLAGQVLPLLRLGTTAVQKEPNARDHQ